MWYRSKSHGDGSVLIFFIPELPLFAFICRMYWNFRNFNPCVVNFFITNRNMAFKLRLRGVRFNGPSKWAVCSPLIFLVVFWDIHLNKKIFTSTSYSAIQKAAVQCSAGFVNSAVNWCVVLIEEKLCQMLIHAIGPLTCKGPFTTLNFLLT